MADNRQNLLNEISDGLKGIRAAINNSSNVTIPEDTPLQDYKDYIEEISQTHVDISKQIFVFYTWAKTVDEALEYAKPSIHWNTETNDGWTVQETNNWKLNIPDNPNVSGSDPDETYYTFMMFVSLAIKDSTGDDFDWPTPVQISGSKGETGDTGSPGRDGIVAGMVLYKTVNLYINSSDKPEIKQCDITFDKENQNIYEIFATDLKINGTRVKDEVGEDDGPGQWYSKYPSDNYQDMIWMIQVSFKSDNNNTSEKSPILLTNPVLIADAICGISDKYALSNDAEQWSDNPCNTTIDNQTCYVKYIITTKYGTTFETTPGVYSKYPKSIVGVTYKYGTSDSTESAPNEWRDTYPTNTSDVVWIQRIETFSDGESKSPIQYPIGLRGPAGIQFIASVESENDLSSISLDYDNNYIGKLGVRVGQNVYVWYGTEDPNLPDDSQIGDNWWLNIGPLSPIPDWNVKEGEDGYIENRTHYEHIITHTKESGDPDDYGETRIDIGDLIRNGINKLTIHYNNESEEVILSEEISSVTISGETFDICIYTNYEGAPNIDDSYIGGFVRFSIFWNTTELKQLDPKFVPRMIEISYADLKNLKDTKFMMNKTMHMLVILLKFKKHVI